METPKLTRVMRIDSIPLNTTYFTEEGYLRDEPIVTSCGIFEYSNADGSIRRELRLPEEVFNKESLKTYLGKPVIITHNAGSIDKENVSDEIVGTILSEGYRDGNDVRCKVVIHDIDRVKERPYRELSLGYNLDLVEEPGEWNGMKYDAIQKNIKINHLAIVGNARAGEQARLNLDGQSDLDNTKKGGKAMAKQKSGLTPEELEEAVKAYRENYEGNTDEDDVPESEEAETEQEKPTEATDEDDVKVGKGKEPQDIIEEIRDNRNSRNDEELEDPDKMRKIIKRQDADIDKLIACLEKTLADLKAENTDADDTEEEAEEELPEENTDGKDSEAKAKAGEENDADDTEEEEAETDVPEESEEEEPAEEMPAEEEPEETDKKDAKKADSCKKKNADSVDAIISAKLAICRAGDRLNMDGLESMSIADGKKAIINKMNPSIRLDGRSDAYIDAMYDLTVADVYRQNTVDDQRKQASTKKNGMRTDHADRNMTAAQRARQKMIEGGN